MKTCEPWAVAAVYLMQSPSVKEHYTDIVNYILKTGLTKLTEKSLATSRTLTQMLNQKVINNHAIFNNDGNGYYALDGEDTIHGNRDIQDVIQSLNDKGLEVKFRTHEDGEEKRIKGEKSIKEDEIQDANDDKLGDEARRLSDEARRLSEQTRKLSDETVKLSDENKKLREETRTLRAKMQLLSDENEELDNEARKLRDGNQQLKEKLHTIKQLCE